MLIMKEGILIQKTEDVIKTIETLGVQLAKKIESHSTCHNNEGRLFF